MRWVYGKKRPVLKRISALIIALLHVLISTAYAVPQSPDYKIIASSINEGGDRRTSSGYSISEDNIADTFISRSLSANYRIEMGFIEVIRTNPPVLLQDIPSQSWMENEARMDVFDLDDYFKSPDGLVLSYSVSGNVNIDVDIDPDTNVVSFSQPDYWSGAEDIIFIATDSEGNSTDSNPVTLTVIGVENAPVIEEITVTPALINETDLVTLTVKAKDFDDDNIIFSYSALFTEENTWKEGGFWYSKTTWQTDYASSGTYVVTVTVTDDSASQLTDSQDVTITVLNVNRPPVMEEIPDVIVNEGELIVITPLASDPDGETVTFYYTSPLDSTGKWQTDYNDAGTYVVTVTASDGIDSVSQDVTITVLNVNRTPEAGIILSSYTVKVNENFTIILNASDPDDDTMIFTLWKDTEQIASGPIRGKYQTTTSISTEGYHEIKAIVTDSGGLDTTVIAGMDVVGRETKYRISPLTGDFNGDGLTDLGQYNRENGKWHVGISSGGEFTYQTEWLSGFGNSNEWVPVGGDFDGDGISDIGIYNEKTGEIKIAISDKTRFIVSGTWGTFTEASRSWQPVSGNYNGDRFTDIGMYNKNTGEWKIALGDGTGFSSFSTWLTGFGGTTWVATGGDYNGDSLSDIGIFNKSTGEWKVAFSDGKRFIDTGNIWLSGFGTDKTSAISDFNNDGLTDAGYWDKDTGEWHKAIAVGNSFVDKGIWISGFGTATDEAAFTGDFNGDGISDAALFDRDKDGIEKWQVRLSKEKFPDLLVRIDNNTGGITTISYKYAARDGNPDVPFPVHVVGSVILTDTLPIDQPHESYIQNFTYQDGYYDPLEREFRGFGKVTVTDPVTGNYTETYFHQGRQSEDGALKGQIDKIIACDGDNRLISQTENIWEVSRGGAEPNITSFPKLKQVLSTVYEENGTSVTTRTTFAYDSLGNTIIAISEGDITITGDERITETDYAPAYLDGYNRPVEIRLKDSSNNLVNKKNMFYDERGNLIKQIDYLDTGEDPVTEYEYDEYGNTVAAINALGHKLITIYEKDLYTFPEKIINELGHTISYTYDYRTGKVLTVTDANNATTITLYDALGRIIEVRNADGVVVTSYRYPDFNTTITTKLNLVTEERVDGLGRKYITITSGEDGNISRNVITEKFYNERGRIAYETLPHYEGEDPSQISYIRYDYDIRGRIIKVTNDYPGITEDSYVSTTYISPLKTEVTDANGNRKATVKDVYDNTVEIIEYTQEGTYHTYYEYDVKNNLTKVIDASGNITTIQYDSLGRKISIKDPDTGTTTYTYDALGNLLTQTDNKGQTITMHYDAISRLIWKEYNDPNTPDVHYYYDEPDRPYSTGRLSRIVDGAGELVYSYDKEGRVISTSRTIEGKAYITETSYDILDRITSITYPDGEIVNYTYDVNSGLLEKVFGNETYASDITYNARGQMVSITYGNGISTNYTYGCNELLSRIYATDGFTALQDLNYTFDKSGNLITLVDNRTGQIRDYTYDDLNRLIHAEGLPGNITTMEYRYDAIGNMVYKSDVGFMTYGENGAGPHAVTTAGSNTYTYDDNGNMVSGAGRSMMYDAENRLISVTEDGVTTNFLYNHAGQRIRKYTDTVQTLYISNIYEIEDNGTQSIIRKYIFAGQNRIASIESTGKIYYYHSDHLGSSNLITDENGNEVQRLEYMPYGQVAINTGTYDATYKFTGKELDNTGLYYFEARYYDPVLGRFITADPTVQRAFDPQDLNRYTYCRNNPLILIDPSGYGWFSKLFKKIGKWISKHKKTIRIVTTVLGIITAVATITHIISSTITNGSISVASAVNYEISSTMYITDTGYIVGSGTMGVHNIAAGISKIAGGVAIGAGVATGVGAGMLAMSPSAGSSPAAGSPIFPQGTGNIAGNISMIFLQDKTALGRLKFKLGGAGKQGFQLVKLARNNKTWIPGMKPFGGRIARSLSINVIGIISKGFGIANLSRHTGIFWANAWAGMPMSQIAHDFAFVVSDIVGFAGRFYIPLRLVPIMAQAVDMASVYHAEAIMSWYYKIK